jgi:hypothetical protein
MVESHDQSQPPSARTSLRDYNQWQVTAALKELGSATRAELRTHTGGPVRRRVGTRGGFRRVGLAGGRSGV